MKKAMILGALAGAMLSLFAGAGAAAAAVPAEGAGATTIDTQGAAQTFVGDGAEAPREVAPPRVPSAGFTRATPPAPNRFVVLPLALVGIAAIGAGAAFAGFSFASRR